MLEPDARITCKSGSGGGPRRSNTLGLPGELIGPFKNGGRELRPKGAPEQVRVHDFMIRDLGRVHTVRGL